MRGGGTDGVRERDGSDLEAGDFRQRLTHLVLVPYVAIRISERHRNIHDHVESRIISFRLDRLQNLVALLRRLVLVLAQKRRRDRIGITKRPHGFGCDRALRTLFVHHDSDDFDIERWSDLLQHLFTVGHLWHRFRRNEAYGINVFEPGANQGAQISRLEFRRDLSLETLPGVAGAFYQFYALARYRCAHYLKNSFARSKKLLRNGVFSSPS